MEADEKPSKMTMSSNSDLKNKGNTLFPIFYHPHCFMHTNISSLSKSLYAHLMEAFRFEK
jgi:hypothetical protein